MEDSIFSFFGNIVTYYHISHNISMAKSCEGAWHKLVIWWVLFCVNLLHYHQSLVTCDRHDVCSYVDKYVHVRIWDLGTNVFV